MLKMILASAISALAFTVSAHAFDLTSNDIAEGATLKMDQVANIFGCKGGDKSPSLAWANPPEGTKSFAISAYDPDAPTGSGFWHWSAFDIPATVTSLPAGAATADGKAMPAGSIQSKADAGIAGFTGACPPPGAPHHYVFTIKALKVEKLGLDANASAAMIGFMANANKLGEAKITALYGQ